MEVSNKLGLQPDSIAYCTCTPSTILCKHSTQCIVHYALHTGVQCKCSTYCTKHSKHCKHSAHCTYIIHYTQVHTNALTGIQCTPSTTHCIQCTHVCLLHCKNTLHNMNSNIQQHCNSVHRIVQLIANSNQHGIVQQLSAKKRHAIICIEDHAFCSVAMICTVFQLFVLYFLNLYSISM